MVAAGGGDHRGQAPVAAREQGLDHAPAVALRPQLDALGLEPFGEQLQPFFGLGAHPLPLEGGVGLGHKGAHPQGEAQPRGGFFKGQHQLGRGFDVGLLFRGQAGHAIELEATQAPFLGVAGRRKDLLGGELFIHHLAHALTATFDRDRERLAAALGQDLAQLGGHRGGPHRTDADAGAIEAVLVEPAEQVGELGVLGDGGAEQAEALGGGQALLHRRNQAVLQGRGAKGQGEVAGQAEAAELGAAAHHLHHVDRGPGRLRRDHGGVAEGVAAPGLLGHRGGDARLDRLDRQQLALAAVAGRIERGHIDPRHLGQRPQALLARGVPVGGDGVDKGRQQQLAIAEQEHVKKGRQRLGIGREHGPAAKHDRIGLAPLLRPDRDALLLQQIKQHRPIQLPAQGEAKQIQARTAAAQLAIAAPIPLAMGRIRLVGEQAPHVHIGPLGQGRPHHLVAQAGDPHRIGTGKGQHRAQGSCHRLGWIKQQGFLVQGWGGSAGTIQSEG